VPRRPIEYFDTTLRDGTQGEKISFSVEDKLRIAQRLDRFGIHYIEGGWPGSNPKDLEFFKRARQAEFRQSKLVAFGSTRRKDHPAEHDASVQALLDAQTPAVAIFGKSWKLHVRVALGVSPRENLSLIAETVAYLKSRGREVIYDAEHFFDGFKDDPDYALMTLRAAHAAGADVLVLCDTNGGTLPDELVRIIHEVRENVHARLGIHAHNDCDMAVANSVAAVEAGCVHVQGTINGYGERCGNANLCSVIPVLQIKRAYGGIPTSRLRQLKDLAHFVSETANVALPNRSAFVGRSAFAHKGGVHVSAVMKDARTYEHIDPEQVGNRRRVLVSDLSGRSNVLYKARELQIDLAQHSEHVSEIVRRVKELENAGYQFEAAEGSFELLVRRTVGSWQEFFELEGFRVMMQMDRGGRPSAEASIKVRVNGREEHTAASGNGPVNALDNALRKALRRFYPELADMQLSDYKVRVLNEKLGTAAKVRVLIDSNDGQISWGTVGVSENIIEASWQALADSICYYLLRRRKEATSESMATAEESS
jgi:2-isopropylmalate synthase